MSTTIDTRVTKLEFDNKQFETATRATLASLESLKKSLNLESAAKGFNILTEYAKKIDFSGIASNVESLAHRFGALGIIGMTALQNITNSAVEAGKRIISALTVEPVTVGFGEYELKMGSIQTIMAGTGESLSTVNKYLEELNAYSDKTIYSFSDMTSNIGKFTNAGVSLKDSTKAIQGISNAAALSGANANEASRAMYNFSQALSSGYVKLIDWKSIELANMATQEFKTQLLESAVAAGTLTKGVDGMYRTIKGTPINATKGFNDSLQEEWMTTKVLVKTLGDYADETTAIGKRAFAAAQDIKTWSQLFGTLKEAAGSGWAQTWELIVGDFGEAKNLFSSMGQLFGGLIKQSADSRNEILQGWRFLGGREALLAGLRAAFQGLMNIMKAVGEVLAGIFPPITGLTLYNISMAVYKLGMAFKAGSENADRLKRIILGIIAPFQIIGQLISAVATHLLRLGDSITGGVLKNLDLSVEGIFNFLAGAADYIVGFKDMLKTNDTFNKGIETMGYYFSLAGAEIKKYLELAYPYFEATKKHLQQALTDVQAYLSTLTPYFEKVRDRIKKFLEPLEKSFNDFASQIKPAFDEIKSIVTDTFKNIDLSGITQFAERIKESLGGGLKGLIDGIGNAFQGLSDIIKRFTSIFGEASNATGPGLASFGERIKETFSNIDLTGIGNALTAGLFGALLLSIKNFIDKGKETIGGVADILDGVRGSLEAWQNSLKAKTLITIATAIAILAASLIALSMVDSSKLGTALVAITAMFAELVVAMQTLDKANMGVTVTKKAVDIIALAVGMVILAAAVERLSRIDSKAMMQGLMGVGIILTELSLFMKKTDLSGMALKSGAGLVAFALGLMVMANAVKMFGDIKGDGLKNGLFGVGVILTEIGVFLNKVKLDQIYKASAGLIIFAGAMIVMSLALKALGNLNPTELVNGLGSMAISLGIIVAALMGLDKYKGSVMKAATGILILSGAMVLMSVALKALGNLNIMEIGLGLLAMGGALALIAITVNAMPKAGMIQAALSVAILAGSMIILAGALKALGNLTLTEIGVGLLAMGGALIMFALALNAMTGTLPAALALLVLAGALALIVPQFIILGSLPLETVAIGLLALAGIFAIFGLAGVLLAPLAPIFFALAGAMSLFGLSCIAVGLGLLLFATGLMTIAVAGAAAAPAIALIITTIANSFTEVAIKLVQALDTFFQAIAETAPSIVDSIMMLVIDIVNGLNSSVPNIITAVSTLIISILTTLNASLPQILEAGFELILTLLKGVRDKIDEVVDVVVDIVTNFVDAVSAKLPQIIQSGVNFIVAFLNGLADAIDNNLHIILAAILRIGKAIIEGLVNAIKDGADMVAKALGDIVNAAIDGIKKFLGIKSPSKLMYGIGDYTVQGLVNGLTQNANSVAKASENLGRTAETSLTGAISRIYETMKSDMDFTPTIRPVMDLTNVKAGSKQISSLLGNRGINLSATTSNLPNVVTGPQTATNEQAQINQPQQSGTSIKFEQHLHSPTPLSRIDIYRQTKNQLSKLNGLVETT